MLHMIPGVAMFFNTGMPVRPIAVRPDIVTLNFVKADI